MNYTVRLFNIYQFFTFSHGAILRTLTEFSEEVQTIANTTENPYIVLMDIAEGRLYRSELSDILRQMQQILDSLNVRYTFFLDGENEEHSKIKNVDNIIYSDFWVLPAYVNCVLDNRQQLNESWNYTASKGLWLPGRLERPHRILVTSKLWEQGLLDKIEWSFYMLKDRYEHVRNFLPEYSDEKFTRMVNECTKTLDYNDQMVDSKSFHIYGYPFDVNLYKNTLFSIVAESDFFAVKDIHAEPIPKITEKTYRTIVNKHPFICSWYPGMIEKLHSKGYRTFEKYLVHKNYDQDLNVRIDQIVENVKYFKECADANIEQIKEDTEYNYQMLITHAKKEIAKISVILEADDKFKLQDLTNAEAIPLFKNFKYKLSERQV